MRAIDADAITYESIDSTDTGRHEHFYGTGIIAVRKEDIDAMPTIQPKRGKWIKTARWGRVYYCNQCRNYLDFDGVNAGRGSTNYCPNCGCRMDGGEQE